MTLALTPSPNCAEPQTNSLAPPPRCLTLSSSLSSNMSATNSAWHRMASCTWRQPSNGAGFAAAEKMGKKWEITGPWQQARHMHDVTNNKQPHVNKVKSACASFVGRQSVREHRRCSNVRTYGKTNANTEHERRTTKSTKKSASHQHLRAQARTHARTYVPLFQADGVSKLRTAPGKRSRAPDCGCRKTRRFQAKWMALVARQQQHRVLS